jgi:hypothetical protein
MSSNNKRFFGLYNYPILFTYYYVMLTDLHLKSLGREDTKSLFPVIPSLSVILPEDGSKTQLSKRRIF